MTPAPVKPTWLWSRANETIAPDPFEALIDQCRCREVPVSLGSDAHEPAMVGKLFPELIDFLKKKGITTFTCFSEGKMRKEKLG